MGRRIKIQPGQQFGRLTVLERAENSKGGEPRWRCLCSCGGQTITQGRHLRSGTTRSCGCLRREVAAIRIAKASKTHGQSGSRLHRIWHSVKERCDNPRDKNFDRYGGRGIRVCSKWKNSFEAFRDWAMANGYDDTLTIDRIDVNGNYEPFNCRWATRKVQGRNKRNNRLITYNDKTQTLAGWAEELSFNRQTLHGRLSRGWSVEDALTTPPGGKRKKSK